jgi:hypothetical protein
MKTLKYFACVAALAVCGSASAGSFTFNFNGTTSGTGTPVAADAQAVFVTMNGSMTITLTNLLVNQTSVGQNISDISFTLGGVSSLGSQTGSGDSISIASNGTVTDHGTTSTAWFFSFSSGTFLLEGLGHPMATGTIVGSPDGSGVYSNGNASLNGSVHNPYFAGPVTFTITNADITSNTIVTGAIFSFGTDIGEGSGTGTCTSGCGENAPDGGTTSLLLGFALTGLGVMRRYLKF